MNGPEAVHELEYLVEDLAGREYEWLVKPQIRILVEDLPGGSLSVRVWITTEHLRIHGGVVAPATANRTELRVMTMRALAAGIVEGRSEPK